MMEKLTSRKFWLAVAAFLASIGTSIAGLAIAEPTVAIVGLVCTILSTAIYQAAEATVDKARLNADATVEAAQASANGTSKVITATSNSNSVVQAALSPIEEKETA